MYVSSSGGGGGGGGSGGGSCCWLKVVEVGCGDIMRMCL